MAVSPRLSTLITAHGIVCDGRAIWICFESEKFGRMGFLGIYAPNSSSERASMWRELTSCIDSSFHWIVGGDFNMIESNQDQIGGNCTTIAGSERRAWQHFARHLLLEDTFCARPGHLRFSWDNRRCFRHSPHLHISADGHRTLRRLDRIYCYSQEKNSRFNITSTILPGFALSDHAPVLSTFSFHASCRRFSQHRMNFSHQSDPAYHEKLASIWTTTESRGLMAGATEEAILFSCLRRARRLDRWWGKQKAQTRRRHRMLLHDQVRAAQIRLEENPADLDNQIALQNALDELSKMEEEKYSWIDFVMQSRWIQGGERCDKTFFQSFKGIAVDSEIPEIFDNQGTLQQSWEGISIAASNFFSGILGETLSPTEEILLPIIERQGRQISEEQRARLNTPFSMEELYTATCLLSKGKCPGPDGIPVEFFIANWPLVGPTVFRALSAALSAGSFHQGFTRGIIVLLKKKGDQRLLANKRPITLLNVIYKIGAKVFQLRLIPILQEFITSQQFAFLPGRNIHHSILLTNELLHQASQSGENFVLLKLDIMKAFDKIEWRFLLSLLHHLGFGGLLTAFLEATYGSASSAVLINGRMSTSFLLSRSVRQGCPLSPLLFILAIDSLSHILHEDTCAGLIEGVRIPEADIHVSHNLFADDLTLVLKAESRIIHHCRSVLQSFGQASGLFIDWTKTNAAIIPNQPIPQDFADFGWNWETPSTATKLLGIHMAQLISEERMTEFVTERLAEDLTKWRKRATTLMGRITIVNHLILSRLWYTLTVWTGKMETLDHLQRVIVQFVWRGQNLRGRARVCSTTITKPRSRGGLGLISIPHQVRAMAGGFITWAIREGDHPLQRLLQHRIRLLSAHRWHSYDFTWIYAPCNTLPSIGSPLWLNICKAWNLLKRHLTPWPQASVEDWLALPLWHLHTNHIGASLPPISRASQDTLIRAGFRLMADVTNPNGTLKGWGEGPDQVLNSRTRPAYERLIHGLHHPPILCDDRHRTLTAYVEAPVPGRGTIIWELSVPRMFLSHRGLTVNSHHSIKRVFEVTPHFMLPIPNCPMPEYQHVERVIIRRVERGGKLRSIRIGRPVADLRFTLQFKWRDGVEFFNTSTPHLRSLLTLIDARPHKRICQWQTFFQLELNLPSLWRDTWLPFRSMSENCFLWQMLYRIPATQHWRFPGLPPTDRQTWCTRCDTHEMEDIVHCIWSCPVSREVWKWVNFLLCFSTTHTDRSPLLRSTHVFVAEAFPIHFRIPTHLWAILRAAAAWAIWKDRCNHFLEGSQSSSISIIHKIWFRLRTYLRQSWFDHLTKIRGGRMNLTQAIDHMSELFGSNPEVWAVHAEKLQIPPVPPRPP